MKNLLLLGCFLSVCSIGCKNTKQNDSVKIADKQNDAKAVTGLINDDVADFLVQAADARMMDSKEGELAIQKGTTQEIKNYGKLMVKDQAKLLIKIKKMAAERNISLPAELSSHKKNGFEELNAKEGKDFDKKFCSMMKIDHERDVKEFTKASSFMDNNINTFAAQYLPMIQSHLDKIKAINTD